jgi:L-erythro-3,5-diaminohexanoate dehydrogenase
MTSRLEALGARRVVEPPGALPQAARRLDAALPMAADEIEIAVDTLCIDSSSFRHLVESGDGDPVHVAESIRAIVGDRGKMYNPVTGSGGILCGTVRAVGDAHPDPPPVGARIVTMVSLTLTPLRLDAVGDVDCLRPHVPVTGTAYLAGGLPWIAYPSDLPFDAALAALDVCNAASQTRSLIDEQTRTMLVLGGGHGGLLTLAAARDTLAADAQLVLVDADERICERARSLGLCDLALRLDLRDAGRALEGLEAAGVPPGDLTVVVVNATDCEAAAILLTADHGTVLFFSMATSFTKAALGADGLASNARMLVGSGHASDNGAYALDLLRRNPNLQDALAEG